MHVTKYVPGGPRLASDALQQVGGMMAPEGDRSWLERIRCIIVEIHDKYVDGGRVRRAVLDAGFEERDHHGPCSVSARACACWSPITAARCGAARASGSEPGLTEQLQDACAQGRSRSSRKVESAPTVSPNPKDRIRRRARSASCQRSG